jgi:hypothetical protein
MFITLFNKDGKLRYKVFKMLCVELKIKAAKCTKMVLANEASRTVSLN